MTLNMIFDLDNDLETLWWPHKSFYHPDQSTVLFSNALLQTGAEKINLSF